MDRARKGIDQDGGDILHGDGFLAAILMGANQLAVAAGQSAACFGDVDDVIGHEGTPVRRG